jgi:hypothetical protein
MNFTFVRAERTLDENQERSYIAAARRGDRDCKERLESMLKACELHGFLKGRGFEITVAQFREATDIGFVQNPQRQSPGRFSPYVVGRGLDQKGTDTDQGDLDNVGSKMQFRSNQPTRQQVESSLLRQGMPSQTSQIAQMTDSVDHPRENHPQDFDQADCFEETQSTNEEINIDQSTLYNAQCYDPYFNTLDSKPGNVRLADDSDESSTDRGLSSHSPQNKPGIPHWQVITADDELLQTQTSELCSVNDLEHRDVDRTERMKEMDKYFAKGDEMEER